MKYYCNPLNISYRYQIPKKKSGEKQEPSWREAADPSMILFKGKYYLFTSMSLDVWVSDDLGLWKNYRLPEELDLYDYAPDVRVIGDYVYYCASSMVRNCDRYRTKDIINGPYEKINGNFSYWDPNLFMDDDGKIYFYWGCSNKTPIYGTELDTCTMNPIGETFHLISGRANELGYERIGEGNSIPATDEDNQPFIEGAWMDKHNDKYYLQYAFAGTEFNTYGNGVYISELPLGPFRLQMNNPYSYHPGGFAPGAGHGSTMEDMYGNFWHSATIRISINHIFERRVGLWPAGYDEDGELFCNQRYGDWPRKIVKEIIDPWKEPEWFLLSAGKCASASSEYRRCSAVNAIEENIQSWWKPCTSNKEEWIIIDLEDIYSVHAVQINFADDELILENPDVSDNRNRIISEHVYPTQWKLLISQDGKSWTVAKDKTKVQTDLTHDLFVYEKGMKIRYLKLTDICMPFGQIACISGIRVFGIGNEKKPEIASYRVNRIGDLDMKIEIITNNRNRIVGYEILWGNKPDKLYHSWTLYGTKVKIGALVKGQSYYIRVDAFNESGITKGLIQKI